MKDEHSQKLLIKLDGDQLEQGTVDAYDLATTVMATADTIRALANFDSSTKNSHIQVDVNALKPGSFEVHFNIAVEVLGVAPLVLPLVTANINPTINLIANLKSLINVKLHLQGAQSIKTQIDRDAQTVTVINFNGEGMTINMPTYNALSSPIVDMGLKKLISPLAKDGGQVSSISIKLNEDDDAEIPIVITKETSAFFEKSVELQTIQGHRVRGVITAMDIKTTNGKVSIGDNNKRANFSISPGDVERIDSILSSLIDSMKTKTSVILEGEIVMDIESNIRHIKIENILIDPNIVDQIAETKTAE